MPLRDRTIEIEAKEKWGQTQAYREYEEKHYSKQAQAGLSEEMDHIMAEFALCMNDGDPKSVVFWLSDPKVTRNRLWSIFFYAKKLEKPGIRSEYRVFLWE